MKKCFACLLVLLMVCSLTLSGASNAGDDVIFTAVENVFARDLTAARMPYVDNGYVYIVADAFSGIDGVNVYYNTTLRQLVIYSINHRITFDLVNDQAYDLEGNFYSRTAELRNGTIFVPASIVCDKFGFFYSFITEDVIAPLVRINETTPSETEAYFVARCTILMQNIYDAYLASLLPPNPDPDTPTPTPDPEPEPEPEPEPDPAATPTYLLFADDLSEAGDDIAATLQAEGILAAFFLTPAQMRATPDLLRTLYTDGHTLGITVPELLPEGQTLLAYLSEANDTLQESVYTKTRLLYFPAGVDTLEQATRDTLIALGYRLWDANIDPYTDPGTSSLYSRTYSRLGRADHTCTLQLLCNQETADTLSRILNLLQSDSYTPLLIREWDTPVNAANDIR